MKRVNAIYCHPRYQEAYRKIQELEKERTFCSHPMTHFLDVARLASIFSLEEGLKIDKEIIYSAALLHDIGRHEEYLYGTPHQEASARIAAPILEDCGFDGKEIRQITEAILAHRDKSVKKEKNLKGFIYRADKMSRNCFDCRAEEQCNWSKKKKNMEIQY